MQWARLPLMDFTYFMRPDNYLRLMEECMRNVTCDVVTLKHDELPPQFDRTT